MRACNMLSRARAFSVGACPPERKNVMPSRFLISQFSLSPVIDQTTSVSVKHVVLGAINKTCFTSNGIDPKPTYIEFSQFRSKDGPCRHQPEAQAHPTEEALGLSRCQNLQTVRALRDIDQYSYPSSRVRSRSDRIENRTTIRLLAS